MRVYIAGPMTGIPLYNFPAFDYAEAQWRDAGHEVTTPARITRRLWLERYGREFRPESDRADYGDPIVCEMLKRDCAAVCDSDAIVLLDGWERSKGTTLELQLARTLGKNVLLDHTVEPPKEETILEEAQRLVYGDRQAAYGHPFDDYQCTGEMWEAMLRHRPGVVLPGGTISPRIACLMMATVKVSREMHAPKRDNRVDGAGYFACADRCDERASDLTVPS